MIYELRIYDTVPGRLPDLNARFANHTLGLFAKHGISSEQFENAFNSFAVDAKVRRAVDLTQRYGIEGVPALVINGKYVTDGVMAHGNRGMFEVTDYLIKKETSNSK